MVLGRTAKTFYLPYFLVFIVGLTCIRKGMKTEPMLGYALLLSILAFVVIYAHDWMTYQAGIKAKEISGKPLVCHIHATSFDRSGGQNINQYVYDLEKLGFEKADRILAVSNYTKNILTSRYGISPNKITVVHNAVEFKEKPNPLHEEAPG